MPGRMHYLLFWLLIIGLYVYNAIPKEGSFQIPAAIGGLAGIILLLLNFSQIRFQHIIWILTIITLCLFSITLRVYTLPETSIQYDVMTRVGSLVVFVYSVTIGYAAYLELTQWNRDRITRMFKILILALLVGAALEVFVPPFKTLSDSFRFAVFAEGVYANDFRCVAARCICRRIAV